MFHMQRQRKLPEEHARFYAAEVGLALNFLHEKVITRKSLTYEFNNCGVSILGNYLSRFKA